VLDRGIVKLNGPEKIAVISQGKRRHAAGGGLLNDRLDLVGSIQETEMTVQVEVDKIVHHSHSIVLGGLELMS
jgi:hypothetical protein